MAVLHVRPSRDCMIRPRFAVGLDVRDVNTHTHVLETPVTIYHKAYQPDPHRLAPNLGLPAQYHQVGIP